MQDDATIAQTVIDFRCWLSSAGFIIVAKFPELYTDRSSKIARRFTNYYVVVGRTVHDSAVQFAITRASPNTRKLTAVTDSILSLTDPEISVLAMPILLAHF